MMSLRQQIESDLGFILEDSVFGFGWPLTVTDPGENSAEFVGFSADIPQVIDPDTGQAISGRLASVTLRTSSLSAAGLGWPKGISDPESKPWVIEFDDINGSPYKFKVAESNPDRALGVITCLLEAYE